MGIPQQNSEDTITVLAVDDEEIVLNVLRTILEQAGLGVLTAVNGEGAISCFRENRDVIRLVVLDVQLPDMSGRYVLCEIQEIDPRVPVLLTSGYSPDEEIEELLRSDPRIRFIQKPFDLDTFVDTAQSLLDNPGS